MGWHADNNKNIFQKDVSEVVVFALNIIIDPNDIKRIFEIGEIPPSHLDVKGNQDTRARLTVPYHDGTFLIQPRGILLQINVLIVISFLVLID